MTAMRRLHAAQATLIVSALAGSILLALAVAQASPWYGAALGALTAAAILWWWRGVFSRRRVVLWLEERVPALRFALAALVDAPDTPFRPQLEARVRDARIAPALSLATLRLLGIPLLVFLASQFVVAPLLSSIAERGRDASVTRPGARDAAGAGALSYSATITPPAYSRQVVRRLEQPAAIAALVGSSIRFAGAFTALATMPSTPTIYRLGDGNGQRLVSLEPRPDSTPTVVLETPARDTVMARGRGLLRLSAVARDDIGIVAGWFEIIVSSGTGESFTFRTTSIGRSAANGARNLTFSAALAVDSLELKPGDVVHLRAVARDANPGPGAEVGSSETRTIRIPRAGENDSLAIEAAPPPEVGRSELSQRMLIILTERLVGRMRGLSREALTAEAQSIGREQTRLRKRVGQIIFTRLTGEDHADEEATAALDDTLSPGEALLKAASDATDLTDDHAHEEGEGGPVVGVNRNLLEAFNAMWAAERRLGVAEPRQALPHMRAALDAIQRARAAERLYLRGRPPRIVLDVARIRLTGKREGVEPGARSPRASAVAATLARRARFAAAVELLATAAGSRGEHGGEAARAAVDSLMLVRVDLLSDQPAAAATISAAIEDLRAGRDATASLIAAHRALAGTPVAAPQSRWSGGW